MGEKLYSDSIKNHLVYWILPLAISTLIIFIFFFDLGGLSHSMASYDNREIGLIENIQLVVLLFIIFICWKQFSLHTGLVKIIFRLGLFATVFVFLEEIDYGLHFYNLFTNNNKAELIYYPSKDSGLSNIHNGFGLTNYFKKALYLFLAIVCFIGPILKQRIKQKWIRDVIPSKFLSLSAITIFIVNSLAHYINTNYEIANQSLFHNISEFEEMVIYYVIFLYLKELKNVRLLNREIAI